MTFLPIAERELRVATRKPGTYRLRVLAALGGLVLGAGLMMIQRLGGVGSARMGATLFGVVTWLGFFALILAGVFLTSDCISQEKREGTIGFLFLTDLRGVDVIFGKLAATSLRGSCAVLATFPILALTVPMGGVSGAQFWRTSLALVAVLACSLAGGIFVSTLSRQSQNAVSATVLLLLAWLTLGPVVDGAWGAIRGHGSFRFWSYFSPAFAFLAAERGAARDYSFGLLGSLTSAAVMLTLASWSVRRTWQEPDRTRARANRALGEKAATNQRPRSGLAPRELLDRNPALWLALRDRGQARGAWVVAMLAVIAAVLMVILRVPLVGWTAWSVCGGLLVFLLYLWTASQASRFFVEARQNGLAEMLLGTPLTVRELVEGQWRCLLRTLGPPLLVFLLVHTAAIAVGFRMTSRVLAAHAATAATIPMVWQVLLGLGAAVISTVSTLGNLAALAWFGMWSGVTSKSTNIAALKAILFVQVIPWFVVSFASSFATMLLLMPLLMNASGGPNAAMSMSAFWASLAATAVPGSLSIVKDLFFICWSRERLYTQLRERIVNPIAITYRVAPRYPGSPPRSQVAVPPVIASQP